MELKSTNHDPRIVEYKDKAIVNPGSQTTFDRQSQLLDKDWAKSAFLISDSEIGEDIDVVNRYWSTASAKFTDARLGCNIGINSKPQFTRYSDVRVKGRLSGRQTVSLSSTTGNYGMGRYYSEAIDDPAQTIYLRFGVPQFNSLTNFLSKAFDADSISMARSGRAPSVFYQLGRAAGTVAAFAAFPAFAIAITAGRTLSYFFTRPTSKFYTLKPTMHLYWSTVGTLVNTIAINRGILPKVLNDETGEALGLDNNGNQRIQQPFKLDQDYLSAISRLMPDVFDNNNYFDIWKLANKAQRLANQLYVNDSEKFSNGTASDWTGYLKKDLIGQTTHTTAISSAGDKSEPTFMAFINKFAMFGYYDKAEGQERMELDPRIDKESAKGEQKKDPGFFKDLMTYFDAEFRSGSQFATFKVEHTGSVSEAFGNSAVESDLSSKLNGISSQVREARFSFADGNIAGDGIGGMIQGALGAVTDLAMGALDGVTMGVSNLALGLGGSGFIDIPKHWQSSSATLPRSNYTIKLVSPYGNAISQIQNIYIPLCMILAGTLPLATGKQSYSSPFLCQIFDRGRCQVRLGMIESLSIQRGTSSLPFDLTGNALAIDVTFTVADMSSILYMPTTSGTLGGIDMTMDEDNILMDYMAVLAGQDLYTQIYEMPKAKLNLAKLIAKNAKLTSKGYWSSLFHESATSGLIQKLTLGSFNAFEAVVRGAEASTGAVK